MRRGRAGGEGDEQGRGDRSQRAGTRRRPAPHARLTRRAPTTTASHQVATMVAPPKGIQISHSARTLAVLQAVVGDERAPEQIAERVARTSSGQEDEERAATYPRAGQRRGGHGRDDDDEPHALGVQMEEAEARVELHQRLVDDLLVDVAHADEAVGGRPREDDGAGPPRQLELEPHHRGAADLGAGDQEHRGQQRRHGRQPPDIAAWSRHVACLPARVATSKIASATRPRIAALPSGVRT